MPLFPATFPVLGLLLLWNFASSPLGPSSTGGLAAVAATLAALALGGAHLLYTTAVGKFAGQLMVIPVVGLAVALIPATAEMGAGQLELSGPIWAAALLSATLLVLAYAVTDQLIEYRLAPAYLRIRRSLATGLVAAGLGLSVCGAAASLSTAGTSPLSRTPLAGLAWTLGLFLASALHRELADLWEDLHQKEWGRPLIGVLIMSVPLVLYVAVVEWFMAPVDKVTPFLSIPGLAAWAFALFCLGTRLVRWCSDRVSTPTILLTTVVGPFDTYDDGEYILDYYSSRFTRGQGPFGFESDPFNLPTHHLAHNVRAPVRVLEYPSESEFEAELRRRHYPIIGIGFLSISRPKVVQMCKLIRRLSPKSKILLGGFGVRSLEPRFDGDESLDGLYDSVSHGEGVAFMRQLLGEDPKEPVDINLPTQHIYPLGAKFIRALATPLVAGYGCAWKCDFCATSAFYDGKHIFTATAEEIVGHIAESYRRHPKLRAVPIFDEDFLANHERAHRLAELMPRSPGIPKGVSPISIFAAAANVSQFTPAELIRMGIRYIWIGVESKFSKYAKLGGVDLHKLFEELYDHGISTTGSFILGFDHHTPENIQEDIDFFTSLCPTTTHIALLGAPPGTAVYTKMTREDRLAINRWEDAHLSKEFLHFKSLPPGMAARYRDVTYEQVYHQHGPSLLRMWKVWLRGYMNLRDHEDPVLRERAVYLKKELRETYPAVVSVLHLGPNEDVKQQTREAIALFHREVDSTGPVEDFLALGATGYVLARDLRLRLFGKPRRQPMRIRATYPERCEPLPDRSRFPEPSHQTG